MPDIAAQLLAALQNPDGGFPPSQGSASEPEPTALAAVALDDDRARHWLMDHQRPDGSFTVGPDRVLNDSPTPLAALALSPGGARERALDYVVSHQAPQLGADDRIPHDVNTRGWGWTSTTFGWVEPTARALVVLKLLRPSATAQIDDGNAVMRDRECDGGGWNYGNKEVFGKKYEAFLQTSAVGLLSVQDQTDGIRERALAVVLRLWPAEPGGLGWAQASAAIRAMGSADADLDRRLGDLVASNGLYGDTVALAWTAIALGDGVAQLRLRPS
jgi:Prenyltransferase and squalene oxidase repeat